jgi:ankyrin repeat protein
MRLKVWQIVLSFLLIGIIIFASWVLYDMGLIGQPRLQTHLFVGIWQDDLAKVHLAIKDGADVNGPSTQVTRPTPLIDACKFGHLEIVKFLLDKGADPNKCDRRGHAALFYTLDSADLGGPNDRVSDQIVKLLIAHGGDISAKGIREALSSLSPGDPRYRAWMEVAVKSEGKDNTTSTNAPP